MKSLNSTEYPQKGSYSDIPCWKCGTCHRQEMHYGPHVNKKHEVWVGYVCSSTGVINELRVGWE